MTALDVPLTGSEHAAAVEPSHAAAAACSDPLEAQMSKAQLEYRKQLGAGGDVLAGSRILSERIK